MPATTRQQLLALGVPPHTIGRRVRASTLLRVHAGIYADSPEWRTLLDAQLLRGGPDAIASHRSAGRLHGLDGLDAAPQLEITVGLSSTMRGDNVYRSGTVEPSDVVVIDGIRVASLVRTLIDLGRVLALDDLELAVESAFRGPDRTAPHLWREDVLAALHDRMRGHRLPGGPAIREVLGRRPEGARPTGSAAETRMLQAMRRVGYGMLLRQPTLRIIDPVLGIDGTWFPDLFDVDGWADLETDGVVGHADLEHRRRDARRDRDLGEYVRVIRVVASDAVGPRSAEVAARVAAVLRQRRLRGWQVPGVEVTVNGNEITILRRV